MHRIDCEAPCFCALKLAGLEDFYISTFLLTQAVRGEEFPIEVDFHGTTLDAKRVIQMKTGLSPSEIRLIFKGRCMTDDNNLSSYGIEDDELINMVLRLRQTVDS